MKDYNTILMEIVNKNPEDKQKTEEFVDKMINSLNEAIEKDDSVDTRPLSKSMDFKITEDYGISKLQFRYIAYLLNEYGWKHSETYSGKDGILLKVYI